MITIEKKLKCASSEELLLELIRRNGTHSGPRKSSYIGDWRETLVGIGPDNTASIRLDADDLKTLQTICGDENE